MRSFWRVSGPGPDEERLRSIDARCDRYEAEWRAARAPRIEDYLDGLEGPERSATWLELAMLDQELRRERGESTNLADYRDSCPEDSVYLEVSTDTMRAAQAPAPTVDWIGVDEALMTRAPRPDDPEMPTQVRRTVDDGTSLPGLDGPFGDYELIERLGTGGMGVVFRARQLSLNRLVALKMIKSGIGAEEKDIRQFRAESEAVAILDHPHIVPVLEIGLHRGIAYYTMRLVEGTDLGRCLGIFRGRPRAIARLMALAAEAIAHAHERGVLHRDIKPTNLLIDEREEPHVIDFGLARRPGAPLATSLLHAGTPSYMAPEQVRGERDKITTATDVYGLGGVLYSLLTGRVPFAGPTPQEISFQVLNAEPVRPRERNPEVDADLETICLKCLSKDPKARYPSVRELAEDLHRWLDGRPIAARPVSTTERAARWVRRHKPIAALSAAAVIGCLVGVAGLAWGLAMAVAARDRAVADEDLSRHRAYAASMNLAERDWRDGNLAEVARHLEEAQPSAGKSDLRGFEWHYLARLARSRGRVLTGHDLPVRGLAYSRDGRWIASGGDDRSIRLWDAATGDPIRSMPAGAVVLAVAFSPDGKVLASAGYGPTITLRDVATGQVIRTLAGHTGTICGVEFDPDGRTLASASYDGTIRLWDGRDGTPRQVLDDHPVRRDVRMAFAPDGKTLVVGGGSEPTIRLWEVATGRRLRTIEDPPVASVEAGVPRRREDRGYLKPIAFSTDGKVLATGTEAGTIHLRDPGDGRLLRILRNPHDLDRVTELAFAPRGGRLASASSDDQAVSIWDAEAGYLLRTLKVNAQQLNGIAFAPDGAELAVACDDGTVRVLEATRDQESRALAEEVAARSVAFGPDGSFLAIGRADGAIAIRGVVDGATARTLRGHDGVAHNLAIAPDGRLAASSGKDGTVRVWELATGRAIHAMAGHGAPIFGLAFSPDGKALASAGDDRTVRIWDPVAGREVRTLPGHAFEVNAVAFAPDGKSLISADNDGNVMIWDAATGVRLRVDRCHPGGIQAIAISPDGRTLATGGYDLMIRLHDLGGDGDAPRPEPRVLPGHAGTVRALAFSPDGRRLASASSDRTVRIWDPASGLGVMVLRGHEGALWSLAFSPDGRRLASAGVDHTVRIWETDPIPAR